MEMIIREPRLQATDYRPPWRLNKPSKRSKLVSQKIERHASSANRLIQTDGKKIPKADRLQWRELNLEFRFQAMKANPKLVA